MSQDIFKNKSAKKSLIGLPLGIIAAIMLFSAFKALSSVLIPITFAWMLSAILTPLVRFLSRKFRIPETLAIIAAIVVTIFVFFGAGVFLNSIVSSFISKYGEYTEKLQGLLTSLYAVLPQEAVSMLKSFDWLSSVSRKVVSLSGSIISISTTSVMVLIITTFMLIEQRDFSLKVTNAFDSPNRISKIIGSITAQVSRYLIIHTIISLTTGVLIWICLKAIGVDFAATWGCLAFVLNYIPTIGSILASIPGIIIALVQYAPESYWPAALTALAFLSINMLLGNIIEPRVMGDHLNLSPVAILISLLFWGWLWGTAGALLATPITAAIKIICDNIEPLEPIGTLLGSARPFRKMKN